MICAPPGADPPRRAALGGRPPFTLRESEARASVFDRGSLERSAGHGTGPCAPSSYRPPSIRSYTSGGEDRAAKIGRPRARTGSHEGGLTHQLDDGALAAAAAAHQRHRGAGRNVEVEAVKDLRLPPRRVRKRHAAQRNVPLDLVRALARRAVDVDGRDAVHDLEDAAGRGPALVEGRHGRRHLAHVEARHHHGEEDHNHVPASVGRAAARVGHVVDDEPAPEPARSPTPATPLRRKHPAKEGREQKGGNKKAQRQWRGCD